MDADDTGLAVGQLSYGIERGLCLLRRVADQRRQQRGGPEATVGSRNGTDAFDGRRVVEQNIAPAVHL